MQEVSSLHNRILEDLERLKLPVEEVYIILRPYSKTYLGRYYPLELSNMDKPKIFLYPYSDEKGNILSYGRILSSAIHEMIHYLQDTNPNFVRYQNVMHDPKFWALYNFYMRRARDLNIIEKEEFYAFA